MKLYPDFKEEELDVLDENGLPTGDIKSFYEIHERGLWHKSVHVWLLDKEGYLLIQKRSNLVAFPGLWDNSAGGHVKHGALSLDVAKEEVFEEIGLDIDKSKFNLIFSTKNQDIGEGGLLINNEMNDVFLVNIDDRDIKINFHQKEVQEVKWIHFRDLKKDIKDHPEKYVHRIDEYDILFEYLENKFKSSI